MPPLTGIISLFVLAFLGLSIGLYVLSHLKKNHSDSSSGGETQKIVTLKPGHFLWTVYVDGQQTEWHLLYPSLSESPLTYDDYLTLISYLGQFYRVQRLWPRQLQVETIEVSTSKTLSLRYFCIIPS